ncbi:MAG: ribosomal protein modification protein RimK [Candidatus Saccharibacteria bacterium]|nr:ribosomal protein modification protein RimK [Candidatus Saccharibacteria bacterium]
MKNKECATIGRNTAVDFIGHATKVPAKIDTGARSSSVWVSNVEMSKDGVLHFRLFDKGSPHYTGEIIKRTNYQVGIVRSSTGHEQIRYKTTFSIRIANKQIRAMLNLSDRSRNTFPVLIGRRTLQGKFIVDVQIAEYPDSEISKTKSLNDDLIKNPYEFHQSQYLKEEN